MRSIRNRRGRAGFKSIEATDDGGVSNCTGVIGTAFDHSEEPIVAPLHVHRGEFVVELAQTPTFTLLEAVGHHLGQPR